MSTKRCRSSSLEWRLIFQAMDWAECADSSSGGPNIISDGHHQRFTASWAMACCAARAAAEGEQQFVPLALVEGLLLADPHHRAGVRTVGAAAQRDLVGDRGAVHQPADRADVRPGQGGVVEDRGVSLAAGVQLVEQLVPAHAEGLGGAVEVQAVARLVLHLGHQDRLAAQRGRAGDPVGLRLHADDLGVGVLGHLADEGGPVGVRHPVARLDPGVRGHRRVESRQQGVLLTGHRFAGGRRGLRRGRHRVPPSLGRAARASAWVGAAAGQPTDRSFGSFHGRWYDRGCQAIPEPVDNSVRSPPGPVVGSVLGGRRDRAQGRAERHGVTGGAAVPGGGAVAARADRRGGHGGGGGGRRALPPRQWCSCTSRRRTR